MALDELKPLIEQGNREIEALRAEVSGMKSADVVAAEKVARIEADLAATLKAKQDAELAIEAMKRRIDEVETKAARPGKAADAAQADEYKSAFISFLRDSGNPAAQQKLIDLSAKATDVRTSTVGSGGYALPEMIATDIAKQVQDMSPLRSICRVVQVGTPDYKELVDLNGFGTEWLGETDTHNQTNTPNLGEVAPTFGELAAKPEATRWSLQDLFFDVEAWITSAAAEQFAIAEGTAFVSGNGTNKPTGFLTGTPVATADSARAFGVLQYYPTGQAAALATNPFDTFYTMAYGVKAGYRPGARWVMNSNTMAALAKVRDAEGVYLLQRSIADSVPDRIAGYGVTVAEDMPDIAANAFPVAFGDWQRGYLIADRVGMAVIRDEVTKPGYLRFIIMKRVGGKVKDSNALKLLKVAVS